MPELSASSKNILEPMRCREHSWRQPEIAGEYADHPEMSSGLQAHDGVDRCPRDDRRAVTLPGFVLLEDGATFSITLLDLTYDGCKIATSVALLPGLKLKLSALSLGALDAHVRWYANGHAGLRFASSTRSHKERQATRLEIPAEVSLRRPGRFNYRARLFDLSATGCRVEFVERPRVGERIWVKFEGFDSIEATVRWRDGFFGGVEFVRPIYPSVFDLLMTRLRAE